MKYQNLLNYVSGLTFGVIAVKFYYYDKFLYYFCFAPIVIIWFILINIKREKQ